MSSPAHSPNDVASVRLSDGSTVPAIAFGVATVNLFKDVSILIEEALRLGYRSLDLAYCYHNTHYVAQGIKASGVPRSELYIRYKGADVLRNPQESKSMRWYFDEACRELDTDYIDMSMLHSPEFVPDAEAAWKEMEEMHQAGLVRSLGISNASSEQLKQILSIATIKPTVLDTEYHPCTAFTYDRLLPLAKEHGITVLNYSPMVPIAWQPEGPVTEALDQIVRARGGEDKITRGQILLMWAHQHNGGIVAMTTTKLSRLAEQIRAFLPVAKGGLEPLTPSEMEQLTQAGDKRHYRHFGKGWPYTMKGEDDQAPLDGKHWPRPADWPEPGA